MKAENENWNKSLSNSEFHYKITVKSGAEITDRCWAELSSAPVKSPQAELPTTLKGVIMVKVNNEVVKVIAN
ncbi:MAG: hypothetical protein E7083_07090 [Bacteroidales bacterium]|nr:hypothetical protein [Bacteroidales bacterium]